MVSWLWWKLPGPQEMNFSSLTLAASPMLQLNARALVHAQCSLFIVINAQMNLIGCSVFSFGTKDQGLKYLSLHSTISHTYCYCCYALCLCCYGGPRPPRIYGSYLIIQLSWRVKHPWFKYWSHDSNNGDNGSHQKMFEITFSIHFYLNE